MAILWKENREKRPERDETGRYYSGWIIRETGRTEMGTKSTKGLYFFVFGGFAHWELILWGKILFFRVRYDYLGKYINIIPRPNSILRR